MKAVQIAAIPETENFEPRLFVLYDDGTIMTTNVHRGGWHEMEQPHVKPENKENVHE